MSLKNLSADSLIETFAVKDEPFDLVIAAPEGDPIQVTLRRITSYGGLRALERDALAWFRILPPADSPVAARLTIPDTAQEAIAAYTIHKLMVNPPFTLDQAVKIQKAPWFVSSVLSAIDRESRVVSVAILDQQVVQEKKDSMATAQDESPLP
ncbi:MAG: hypothetical protein ACOYOL_07150 [Chthoniobacterales bacterium]